MLLPLRGRRSPLAALTALTLGGPLTAYGLPAISIMTDAIERVGAALAFGSMLFNLAWATGETIGAPAAASVSRATSDAVPLAALAAVMLATLVAVVLARRSLRSGRGAGHVQQLLAERLVADLGHADARIGQHAQRIGRQAHADGRALAIRHRVPALRTSA